MNPKTITKTLGIILVGVFLLPLSAVSLVFEVGFFENLLGDKWLALAVTVPLEAMKLCLIVLLFRVASIANKLLFGLGEIVLVCLSFVASYQHINLSLSQPNEDARATVERFYEFRLQQIEADFQAEMKPIEEGLAVERTRRRADGTWIGPAARELFKLKSEAEARKAERQRAAQEEFEARKARLLADTQAESKNLSFALLLQSLNNFIRHFVPDFQNLTYRHFVTIVSLLATTSLEFIIFLGGRVLALGLGSVAPCPRSTSLLDRVLELRTKWAVSKAKRNLAEQDAKSELVKTRIRDGTAEISASVQNAMRHFSKEFDAFDVSKRNL